MGDAERARRSEESMTLRWSPESIHDLSALRDHISADDAAAAKRVALYILYCVEQLLSNNPQLGHPGHVPGTPSWSFRKRLSSFPTVFAVARWKFCASITTLAAGPTACSPVSATPSNESLELTHRATSFFCKQEYMHFLIDANHVALRE
jgi:plasmid stabilization system protein ParE